MDNSSENQRAFEVERILRKRTSNGFPEYRVKWKRFPSSQNTWEPLSSFKDSMDLVHDFEAGIDTRQQGGFSSECTPRKIARLFFDDISGQVVGEIEWDEGVSRSIYPVTLLVKKCPKLMCKAFLEHIVVAPHAMEFDQ